MNEHEPIPAGDRAALEACPRCAAELASLAQTRDRLDERAARLRCEEAEDLVRLTDEKRPEDGDLVRAIHERHLASEPKADDRSQPAPWRLFLALAAAALVATLIPRRAAHPNPAPAETMLGVSAQGAVVTTLTVYDANGLQLAWEPLAAHHYRLVIMDAQLDELDTISVTNPELQVDAARSAPWPNELKIEIIPLSVAGRPVAPSTTLSVPRAR